MSHAAAEVGIRRGGLPSQLLLGDDSELIGQGVSVCHGGPPLVGVFCEVGHGRCRLRRDGSLEVEGNGHSLVWSSGEFWCDCRRILGRSMVVGWPSICGCRWEIDPKLIDVETIKDY